MLDALKQFFDRAIAPDDDEAREAVGYYQFTSLINRHSTPRSARASSS